MSTAIYVVLAIVALGLLYIGIRVVGGTYLKFRGKRVITCPETSQPAGVDVAAGRAALSAALGKPAVQLRDCSRWPERQNCGQECLQQLEAAPEDCLVRTILTRWYQEKSCIYCGKALGEIDWIEQRPCLLSPAGKTIEWREVPAEEVPRALETHKPVCWNCHIAETFRREHPDLVTERNWKTS